MQGDIANAYGSINRLAVLKAVRKHAPCLAPLCASQFVRNGTIAVIQERGENGRKAELHDSVAKGVWQGSTLSSAAFCLTFWSKMTEVIEHANREKPIMGMVAYADDFVVSSDNVEADRVWDETTMALGEIGLEIDQSKSCYTRQRRIKLATQDTHIQKRDCGTGNRNNGMELDGGGRNGSDTGTEATG